MAKTNYADMSYEELQAEKWAIDEKIRGLKVTKRELARLMDAKIHDQRLQAMADKLSPEEKAQLKDKL